MSRSQNSENPIRIEFDSLRQRAAAVRSLERGLRAVNSTLTLEEILAHIVQNVAHVMKVSECSIGLLDEGSDELQTVAAYDIPQAWLRGTRFKLGTGIAGLVAESGEPLVVDDVTRDGRFLKLGNGRTRSIASVPLITKGEVIGTITVTSSTPQAFSSDDVSLLQAFADQASLAISNASLYEDALRKRDEMQFILEGIGDAVIFADLECKPVMLNPAALRLLGDGSGSQGDSEGYDALKGLMEQACSNEDRFAISEIWLRQEESGEKRAFHGVSSVTLGGDGLPRGIVTVLRDITPLKEVEAMKSNFMSAVSHDLLTPLSSISGFVEIILQGRAGPLTPVQADFLDTVRTEAKSLKAQVDELLELLRLESRDVKLNIAPLSLHHITTRVLEQLSVLAQLNEVKLLNKVEPSLPQIEGDSVRLQEVIVNLVGNAIKFTPKGGTVTIEARDLEKCVEIAVVDTGIGIPMEEQERLFQSFYQAENGQSSERTKGFGLGLAICKQIVEKHGGTIEVHSKPNEGSRFTFMLLKRIGKSDDLSLKFRFDE